MKKLATKLFRLAIPLAEPAEAGEPVARYRGIQIKMLLYCFAVLLGLLLFIALHLYWVRTRPSSVCVLSYGAGTVNLTIPELFLMPIAYLMSYVRIARAWSKVTGMLYSLSAGYLLAFELGMILSQPLRNIAGPAAVFLFLTLVPLCFIRRLHLERHPRYAYTIIVCYALLILGRPLLNLFSYLPGLSLLAERLLSLRSYRHTTMIIYVIGLLLSEGFLLLSMQRCRDYVKRSVKRKYEWVAAFVLFFNLMDIGLRMLSFILRNVEFSVISLPTF